MWKLVDGRDGSGHDVLVAKRGRKKQFETEGFVQLGFGRAHELGQEQAAAHARAGGLGAREVGGGLLEPAQAALGDGLEAQADVDVDALVGALGLMRRGGGLEHGALQLAAVHEHAGQEHVADGRAHAVAALEAVRQHALGVGQAAAVLTLEHLAGAGYRLLVEAAQGSATCNYLSSRTVPTWSAQLPAGVQVLVDGAALSEGAQHSWGIDNRGLPVGATGASLVVQRGGAQNDETIQWY